MGVYAVRQPIGGNAQSIVLGQSIDRVGEFEEEDAFYGMKASDDIIATITDQGGQHKVYNPNAPMPPIVWTKSYQIPSGQVGQSVTSTIGAATDLANEEVRRLFINTTYYLLDMEVPLKSNVMFVGEYSPSAFKFHSNEYWAKKQLKVLDFAK